MGYDMISSEDEGGRGVVTSVVHRKPMAMSVGGGHEVERRGDIPMPRKCATSSDTIGEREAKRTRSPRPSEALPVLSPPAVGMAG